MNTPMSLDPETYAYLRSLAARVLGPGQHTLQPTGLLHEAWARLAGRERAYADQQHFLRTAAKAMRHILVDRARARNAEKRGGGAVPTTLSGIGDDPRERLDVVEIDRALTALEEVNESAAQIVLMRTFGGLTIEETADALGLSTGTVKRHWRFARAWLLQRMGEDAD